MRSSTSSTNQSRPDHYIDWPIIIGKWPVDYLMDPIHYDKIADQLMQFRGKLPHPHMLSDKHAEFTVDQMLIYIDGMLANIDAYAKLDAKGWIR